jgi:hypothetical protein
MQIAERVHSLAQEQYDHWCAELHRLRGVFLKAMGADETQIEVSFGEAIRIAKEQKSVSLEKRAEATYAEYRRQKASGSAGGKIPTSSLSIFAAHYLSFNGNAERKCGILCPVFGSLRLELSLAHVSWQSLCRNQQLAVLSLPRNRAPSLTKPLQSVQLLKPIPSLKSIKPGAKRRGYLHS